MEQQERLDLAATIDRLEEENRQLREAMATTDCGRALLQQEDEFSRLLSLSKRIVSELDVAKVFALVADNAREIVCADLVLVPMLNEKRDHYSYAAASGVDAELVRGSTHKVNVGMCGWVLQHERSLLFGETSPHWLEEKTPWEAGQQSAVLVPLFGRDGIIGGLSALGKQGGGAFTLHDLDLLTMFANQVSIAIENATMFQQVQKEIEERKQVENSLRTSESRLHLATRAGNIGIWDWNIVTNELIWDESMYSLYGIRQEDFRGAYEAWSQTLHPDDRQFTEGEIAAALRGEREYAPEFRIVRPDGTVRFIKAESHTIRNQEGEALRMIGTNIDISANKQAEMIIREQVNDLERKNAELERFTYTVSHDLKSPLITIRGFLGSLVADAKEGRFDRMESDIARISNATDKMQSLLNDLLSLSRIGRIVNPPVEFSMTQVAHEVVELLHAPIQEKKIELLIDHTMPAAFADKQRIREVLQNLVENAIKYMGDQPSPQIEIGYANRPEGGAYFVKDNGMGVDPKYHKRIFGLFEKLDAGSMGTGIGLALVKRIVELHGGKIVVESAGRGQGASFFFTLPGQTARSVT